MSTYTVTSISKHGKAAIIMHTSVILFSIVGRTCWPEYFCMEYLTQQIQNPIKNDSMYEPENLRKVDLRRK
jgi:hypothetical protein